MLLDCLARLSRAAPGARVVVVDTDPLPGVEEQLAGLHPEVEFLPVPNHSYSRSVNLGLAALPTPLLTLMNADVLVEPGTFTDLLGSLRQYDYRSVVAPVALDGSGDPQPMGWPYQLDYLRLRRLSRGPRAGDPPPSVSVSWVAGYLQTMHRDLWNAVGGYDESFRFFNEDLDFCLRARSMGFGCRLVDSPVVHLGGSSTPDHPAFHVEGRRGGFEISRRHHGRLRQLAHEAFLWTEAALGVLTARSEEGRAGHTMMLELLRSGAWHESPFGETLDQRRTAAEPGAPKQR